MLEIVILGCFSAVLLTCILLDYSIIYALVTGYLLFFSYGMIRKFAAVELLKMSWTGIKTVKNILITFILIGMITAVWRAAGTIPFIIYYSSQIITPSIFVLITFLLCCLVSVLTGTAFGTSATVGVICATLANVMGINPVFIGGAVLSGVFFGDRCSPMSTSALLISELTGTDIYINIKNMVRTCIVPFLISCAVFLLMGLRQGSAELSIGSTLSLFKANFNMNFVVVIPALLIILLCVFKVKVRIAMISSILTAGIISMAVQRIPINELIQLLLIGFKASDMQIAAMMDGGGVVSMVRVSAIVCISSSYIGIFEKTGLLSGVKTNVVRLSSKITPYGCTMVSSAIAAMVACNQTLCIMLTHYLCKELANDEQSAINLENTAVIISPLVPWSIASVVPLSAVGAPKLSILAACYLYILPLWNFIVQKRLARSKTQI